MFADRRTAGDGRPETPLQRLLFRHVAIPFAVLWFAAPLYRRAECEPE
jgi:hypothetical protein